MEGENKYIKEKEEDEIQRGKREYGKKKFEDRTKLKPKRKPEWMTKAEREEEKSKKRKTRIDVMKERILKKKESK